MDMMALGLPILGNNDIIKSMSTDQQDLQEKAKKIKAIYNDAVTKIRELEKQQKQVVADFIKKLEQKKIEEIRKLLLNS